ncbi:MAG TPA: alginate lyase family protein [Vicinamibacterales bacterium]|nr:alginate lyase family protein [Vicinamibacterales bacterium]
MRLSEIAGRGRQELRVWFDRAGVVDPVRYRWRTLPDRDRFLEMSEKRFFAGVAQHVPARVGDPLQMIADAERLCAHRFRLLGYEELSFGDPIDWHLDPVSGRRSPLVHWSRVDPLDWQTNGDSKVIWELNRHQWLLQLGQAYRFTRDERFAEAFASAVREWMHANPEGIGINWASSLEVALRLIAWCWALSLFAGSAALTDDVFKDMLRQIEAHAAHVEKYLSYYFSPNTHLTGEALGLFYAGVVCAGLERTSRWRALGARILVEQIGRQVCADGVYFEQSTYYQRYTIEIYLHFLLLAARNRIAVSPLVAERVQLMLDFLLAVRGPDGSMPQIGDSDGGSILPLEPRAADDLRGIFSTAAALFGRSDYAWAAGGPAHETFWLLGEQGLKSFDALEPAPPARPPSRLFADGGYVVMRSGWQADAHHLIFDVGPLGCSHSGGHGHADLLSIQCSAFGEPYLVDAGTYCYTAEPASRDFFRCSNAHSTVLVDGIGQAVPAGPFAWRNRPQARLRRWVSTETYDLADADHDAYCALPDHVVHRRRVLFVKPRFWIVVDDLEGLAEHHLELRFQFAPLEVKVQAPPGLWACARRGTRALWVRPFAMVPLEARVGQGEVDPLQGWVSPDYGQRRPAPVLVYSTIAHLPFRVATVLVPAADPDAGPPRVSLDRDDASPCRLAFEEWRESVEITETTVRVTHE